MNKRVRRLLLQVFSSLNALFLTFQPLAALPVLLANPAVVQAEASVNANAVDLTFDEGSHEFRLRVKTDQAMPYVLTYLDEKQDPQVEQAAQGYLEKMEEGVFGADVYAGTCSGDDCTPITFIRGTLAVGDSFKNSFQLVNGAIVFDGPKPAEDQICVNPDEVGLTAGETLWSVDETTGVAETKTKVQPGVSYQFPLDDSVSVTFSCLPKDENLRSPLKIQQVLISELNLPNSVKTDATYAYDITTEMENGTFEYELTLPKAENAEVEVQYIEKTLDEAKQEVKTEEVKLVEENENIKIDQKTEDEDVTVTGLDHFTIFVVVYDSFPAVMPGSYPSVGFAATSTFEFGDHLLLSGTERNAGRITVEMTNWACENDFTYTNGVWVPNRGNSEACITTPGSSYTHPLTLNVYSVNTSGAIPIVGSLILSKTINATVPFRPSYDQRCTAPENDIPFGGTWYDPVTQGCVHGYNFDAVFDLAGEVLPDQIIASIAFNTQSYGITPLGQNGPYNSLNMSVGNTSPSAGTNVNPDDVFWNTTYGPFYTDGGASGVGILRQDTGWTGYVPVIKVEVETPTPTPGAQCKHENAECSINQSGMECCAGLTCALFNPNSGNYKCVADATPTPTPTPGTALVCGDGVVNNNEACDYGLLNGQSSCSAQCTWVSECRQEMVANGGFETPVVSQGAGWDAFDNTQMAGWTAEWYGGSATYNGHDRPEPKTELHRGVSGWSPASGSQYVELDTDWTGPVNGFNGEPASIALSQDIPTIPGYQYTLNWKHSPRPNHNNNHLQVVVGDTEVFNSGNLAGGSNTNWQTQSYSFVATTDLTTISFIEIGMTDSFGMFLDDVSVSCDGSQLVTVYAHKVICQSESDLPNWGDDAGGQVTATTAQDYVNQSQGRCRLAEDWDFEWGYDGSAPKQSGEYVGYAGAPWTEFNVKTFEASPAAAIIPNPDGKTLWFREVLQEGYIPFTYPPDASPGSNVSAEFYCNNDHYKYDNYESISNAKPGDTYYCVAFNAPTAKDVEICKVDNQDKAQSGWTVGLAKQTPEFNEVIPVTSGAGVDAALPAGEHVVFASGTYRYGSSAMIADAGFSYRPLSIPMGADGWVSGDQLTTVGGLELKVGGQNIAWGGYNPTHQYTTLVSGFAGGNLNFNIWDNQYSDNLNNGNFRAQVHQVITTGVTEDDGCVTLEDVPYGDYVAFELPQDNWSHVSTMVNGQNTDTFPAPITVGGRDSSVTFENRLVTGQLRVQKTTDPAGDPTVFNLTATGGGLVFGSATGSVTDATDYTYTVEPQTYSVSEDIPNGWELTSNNCSNLLVPSDGQRVCQISNTKLYDIHGYKWNDVNRNAIDDQEARLPGWEIFIDQNDNQQWDDGEPKTTTSSDPDHLGWYWFENLYAGTYDVCEILQDGWAQTYPVDPMCHSVTLPDLNPRGMAVSENAVVGPEYNFGNTQYGDASVYKYEDLNTNGKYDAGEPLLPDWEMVLGSSDNGELRQTTDTSGNTVFDVLGGTYYLSEEMQEGWYQSAISCDSNLGGVMITQPNYAYGHHGMCSGWNTRGDAATCALKACEANGYSTLVSYGDQRPCTEFDNCSLFYNINEDLSYQADWGNWCGVMGVTDIVCSNSSRLIRPVVNKPVVVNPGETSTCYVGNYKPGIIEGTKYFDADQDGRFDDGESVMQYWGISLTGPDIDQQVVTDENGAFSFTNLKAGTYTLCEEDRTAWGWQVTEPAEPIDTVCREVVIDRSGETEIANFGNFIDSRLYILKTNDAWPTDVTIGDEVTYTIRVMAVGGPVYDATVLDVPPAQLSYVPDSYTAESSNGTDLRADGTTGDPNYQSPGKWTLGDLDKDEIVTLTYKAKVGTLADPGVYPDMVWATGTSEQSRATEGETDDLLALSDPDFSSNSGGVDFDGSQGHFGEDNFAGTQVAVVLDQTPFSEYQVGKTEEKQGDVLGASTELPATGARTWLTLLALISIVAGAGFLIMGKRSRNSGLKTLVGLFVVGFSLWFAQPAQALTSVRVEEPYNNSAEFTLDAITNQTTMKIDFVVLNTDNISVTAQCQQQRNDGAWSNITTNYTVKAGGNSGYCEAKDLEHDQNYDFRVVVSGDGPDKISDEVRVGLDTNRPDKPVNYSKNPGNYCEDKIGFKTANDGQTSSVEVYRSTDNDHFTAKPDTRVITIPIGPNQEYTLTTSKPNCDDTYYYVIRAFDVNGNASDLVGDLEIKTVIIESASGTTQTVQLGAIPAGSAFIAGGSTTDETAEGTTGEGEEEAGEPETTAEPTETESTEGTVLGSATETFMSFLTRFGLPIGVGLIVLAGLYVIFFGKRNEK